MSDDDPRSGAPASILAAADANARDVAVADLGGSTVQRKRGREVFHLPGPTGALFVKWFGADRLTEGRAERDALRRLAVTGIPAAALLSVEESAAGIALLMEDAGPGLDEVMALEGHLPEKRRMRLERAARTVAALHAAGFLYPDLLARHLRVGADGEMRLIDAERMRGPGVRSPLRRAVDLGTFLGTLPRLAVPERDRLRWFRAATRDLDRVTRRTLARRVLSTVAKTRDRTRHRHGAVELHPRSRHVLIAGVPGALSFETWFDGEVGERLRRLPDRENRRLEVDGRTFFLKRHFDGSRAAIDELDGTLAFRRAGLPAVIPAAVGEDVDRGSFWLAEQAEGEPLDDLLARGEEAVPFHARRELARILGRHAARLRRAGRFHRDFYLNHWIGCWSEDNGWTLSLI
ncbi:MAG: lipopolysaccharide kinase InaA family protein, partial [Planctomycetota bacterium]